MLVVLLVGDGCNRKDIRQEVNVDELKGTEITSYFEREIGQSKNLIFCSTFQLAWNEFKTNVFKEDIHLTNEPSSVSYLNKSNISKQDISDKDYVAMVGRGSDNIIGKINEELKNKFSNPPIVSDQIKPDDFFAYAYLNKNLEFENQFEVMSEPLKFKDSKVKSFGIKNFDEKSLQLGNQVEVYDYINEDDYIIKLISKDTNDEIVLAKIPAKERLDLTYEAVTQRIEASKPIKLGEHDSLIIPLIDLNISNSYDELLNKNFLNAGWEPYFFYRAIQIIDFHLNNKGAVLKSESKLAATKQAIIVPSSKPIELIFNNPFLLYLKEKQAVRPYLTIWVNDPEIMEKSN